MKQLKSSGSPNKRLILLTSNEQLSTRFFLKNNSKCKTQTNSHPKDWKSHHTCKQEPCYKQTKADNVPLASHSKRKTGGRTTRFTSKRSSSAMPRKEWTYMTYYFHEINSNKFWTLLALAPGVLQETPESWQHQLNCLLQLVRGETKIQGSKRRFELSDVRTLLTALEETPASVDNSCTNVTIQTTLTTFTEEKLTTYLAAPKDNDTEDALTADRIKKALHVLKIHMFGRGPTTRRNSLMNHSNRWGIWKSH